VRAPQAAAALARLFWTRQGTQAAARADAILGALSQPDIGQLFPDSDPRWKGQTSDVFVREAVRARLPGRPPPRAACPRAATPRAARQVRLMRAAGYRLGNVDATIILQRPKLSPHKEAMRANLCRLLDANASVVNIKARPRPRPDAARLRRGGRRGRDVCWPRAQAKTHEKVDSLGENRSIAVHAVIMLIREDLF